jgi:hypothetical protein
MRGARRGQALLAAALAAWSCGRRPPGEAPVPAACPEPPLEEARRIYDLAPTGAENPVLATVDGCWIQVPLRELRGHLAAELSAEQRSELTPEGARQQLERLVDEHLILRDAYRQQADRSPRAQAMLAQTRRMLLGEHLEAREVDARARGAAEHAQLRARLLERARRRARISVSAEGWAALRAAAAAGPPPSPGHVLVAFEETRVTVAQALAVYAAMPPRVRPRLDGEAAAEALIEHLLEYELLAAEAVAEGLDRSRPFLEKVELNRSAIVRMWWHDALARRVEEQLAAPGLEGRLRAWHAAQDELRHLAFAENRERIASAYRDALREELRAGQARALRQGRRIAIDQAALARQSLRVTLNE